MTTDYPPSDSDKLSSENESDTFLLLNEKVQRWVWSQDWEELHDIQEKSIKPILSGNTDVIICSPTASGKTEAAFLPIFSKLVNNRVKGIQAVYISPLKALINDQFERLYNLSEQLEIPVHKWHGDISYSYKMKLLQGIPQGILQITPESLESLFINHFSQCKKIFSPLLYVIIDELHYFIGSERGKQLQSLLKRLEIMLNKIIPRIGLSATLGDITLAHKYLRPSNEYPIEYIHSDGQQETKLQIRGYLIKNQIGNQFSSTKIEYEENTAEKICYHLFNNLRGKSNLIFANSRAKVEEYTDLLIRICEKNNLPNEFFPHHGNLSKQIREDVESKVKNKSTPATAVCTSTLELGIDIGSVHSIAQVGVPPSVSSLRQRLGRSGRRGEPAILRVYIAETELNDISPIQDQLRSELFQTVAMIELLKKKWYEPPIIGQLHLSTLLHQILALISQYGGILTESLWNILIKNGAFNIIPKDLFLDLLKDMGKNDLITQTSDNLLLLGLNGERLVNDYSFYSVFITSEEYRLISNGTNLGTLPVDFPINKGLLIIFAGKRWEIVDINEEKKIIELRPSLGGKPPRFFGSAGMVRSEIRLEMFKLYSSEYIPIYMDNEAVDFYKEGLANFIRFNLKEKWMLQDGKDTLLFIWYGDRVINTFVLLLQLKNVQILREGFCIRVINKSTDDVEKFLKSILQDRKINEIEIVKNANNKKQQKYDYLIHDHLLNLEYSSRYIDLPKTLAIIKSSFSLN